MIHRMLAVLVLLGIALPDAAAQAPAPSGDIEYKPPVRGAPARRVGGSSRGAEELPMVSVIAPDHVGYTHTDQPSLYWFLSKAAPVRVEITLIDAAGEKPVVETSIANAAPGIHRLRLSDFKVRLKPDEEYQWSVSLVGSETQRSNDVVSQGAVKFVAPTAEQKSRLAGMPAAARADALAAAGVWYDAIDALSESIAQQPGDRALREKRAKLLAQVGLKDAAAFERK